MSFMLLNTRGIFLQGCSSSRKRRGLLQVDTSSQILRKQMVFETTSPFDRELSKMQDAEFHVFSDSVLWDKKR